MRIGFDIDGVLANFIPRYEEMFVFETGRNDFPPIDPVNSVPIWNWPDLYGYTSAETRAVWQRIKTNNAFWSTLNPTPEFSLFARWFYHNEVRDHEIYFVTSRPGINPKLQTEEWFYKHLGCPTTVLISEEKGEVCHALNLDLYVDDKAENIRDVTLKAPNTKAYLIDRAYNRHMATGIRIASLEEFLQVAGWR